MPVRHRRSNRQSSVSGREPTPTARPVTRLALPTSPPHRRNPKLLATRPSFVTRYRPPAPTHCTHPSPSNRRNNRLKFFPLAPNGSPPSPSISSTSPHCSSVSRGTGTNGPTGNNRIHAGLIPHPSASHGAEPGTTFLLPLPLRVSADARRRDQLSKEWLLVRQLHSMISST